MKHLLSIHVYDETTASEINDLIGLLELMKARVAPADPAPGHHELPLDDPADADTQWGLVEPEAEAVELPEDAFDANDPTRQRLPWSDELSIPPMLPYGKMRWVYRGTFEAVDYNSDSREVRYWDGEKWCVTLSFSGPFHHIEAV